MRSYKQLLITTCALAFGALAAGPALAQSAPGGSTEAGQDATRLDEIVVTARRVEERLQDVPLAITAIQGETLQELGVTQVSDLRQAVAGLMVTPAAGRTTSAIFALRGQRATDITITQDPAVAIYVDDVIVTPLAGGNLGLFDLANVQVLKGPQGTLFGRNTTGGAILYTTAAPTNELGGRLRLGYGNYGAQSGTGVLNLPVSDIFQLRGAIDYTKTDGFGEVIATPGAAPGPAVGRALGDRDELSLRLSAAFNPTDALSTLTTLYRSEAESGGPAYKLLNTPNPAGPGPFIFGAGFAPSIARAGALGPYNAESNVASGTSVEIEGVNHTSTLTLNDTLTFKTMLGYRHTQYSETLDFDGTGLPLLEPTNRTDVEQYSVEPQLQGEAFEGRLNFVAGVYYFQQKGFDGADNSRAFGRGTSVGGDVDNTSLSAFAQGTYALSDTLNVTAGLRYTEDRRNFITRSGNGSYNNLTTCNLRGTDGLPLPLTACRLEVDASFSEPSWLLSIDKSLSDETLIYASHRHGYRSGGFNLRATSNRDIGPFQPEIVDDIEFGFKNTVSLSDDWSLRSNLAAYYQWYKDIQRNVTALTDGQLNNSIRNAASANVYGAEAEFELRHGRDLSFSLNYAFVKPSYDSYPLLATVNGVAAQPADYSDRDFTYIPRHQLNFNVRYARDLNGGSQLVLVGGVYYQSEVFFSEEFQTRAQLLNALSPAARALAPADLKFGEDGYTLVNLRAELNNIGGSNVGVAIYGRNVLDESYIQGGSIFYTSLGIDTAVYGDPRTYGIELTYDF